MYCKNRTSSRLASKINLILANHSMNFKQIDYITISIGPGTFTGIRVGLSLAQGLAFAEKIPIVPVNIMDVLHSQLSDDSSGQLGIYSHKNLAYFRKINSHRKTIKLQDITAFSSKKIYGIGLNEYKSVIDYTELSFSSKELAEFSINNYNNLATKNIDSIEPIYLNEYNTNLQL